jgi:hypothetical protein
MTFDEHTELGHQLRQIYCQLLRVECNLAGKCGTTVKVTRAAEKATRALSTLRSELDNLLFKEHASRPTLELINVYYGTAGQADP